MSLVLTLIAGNSQRPLALPDIDRARRALEAAGAAGGSPDWLSPGEACDIPFQGPRAATLSAARTALRERPLDVNVVAAGRRRKRLLLADMDSTLIEQECIDELAAEAGSVAEVAAITEQAMRGEIAFEPALRARVALLRGLSTAVVARLLAQRVAITPGAALMVGTMRAAGAYTVLVSGGFTAFTAPIAGNLGLHEQRANILREEAGTFTGQVAEPIFGRDGKRDALLQLAARFGLDPAETLAVGDGANDIGMIRIAGLGVAFRAKPALRAAADAAIDHADLTGILFLQGFRREEFVCAAPAQEAD